MDENDVLQDVSPLEIPTIKVTEMHTLNGEYGWWDIACAWVNQRTPKVLVQFNRKQRYWLIHFQDIEDYRDFVLNFPEVLKEYDDDED